MSVALRRSGFTLVELMIVLAIIAITAAYAVPAYQNYIARSRVGEGLALAAEARLSVAENASLGLPLGSGYRSPPATANVLSLAINAGSGQITIAYSARVAPERANSLVLVPSAPNAAAARVALLSGRVPAGPISWECFAAGKAVSGNGGPLPGAAGTLAGALAMAECRG
jgi:type IV pilus assembly protein PilA